MNKPTDLSAKTSVLWDEITSTYDLNPAELIVLEQFCKQTDLITYLEGEVNLGQLTITGSRNNQVVNPLLSELRQQRMVLSALVKTLRLPETETENQDTRSTAGRDLVNIRWGKRTA